MTTHQKPDPHLTFYARPAAMTAAGRHAALLSSMPHDVAELTRIAQGLVLHEFMGIAYGVEIPAERKGESHIRPVSQMLDRLLALDARPLAAPRQPEQRLVGVCRHFVVLLVTLMRAVDIPARARCGFGNYFNPGYLEDHWVCEYWNINEERWVLVDPQFDEVWRAKLRIEHDVLNVPRDRFLVAGDAWVQCRTGAVDPAQCGIFRGNLRGLWFVAGNLVRDLAALNNVEMLPWDVWGAMPGVDERLGDDLLAFFAQLPAVTRDPQRSSDELRTLYRSDDGLRVPSAVFNAITGQKEFVEIALTNAE